MAFHTPNKKIIEERLENYTASQPLESEVRLKFYIQINAIFIRNAQRKQRFFLKIKRPFRKKASVR